MKKMIVGVWVLFFVLPLSVNGQSMLSAKMENLEHQIAGQINKVEKRPWYAIREFVKEDDAAGLDRYLSTHVVGEEDMLQVMRVKTLDDLGKEGKYVIKEAAEHVFCALPLEQQFSFGKVFADKNLFPKTCLDRSFYTTQYLGWFEVLDSTDKVPTDKHEADDPCVDRVDITKHEVSAQLACYLLKTKGILLENEKVLGAMDKICSEEKAAAEKAAQQKLKKELLRGFDNNEELVAKIMERDNIELSKIKEVVFFEDGVKIKARMDVSGYDFIDENYTFPVIIVLQRQPSLGTLNAFDTDVFAYTQSGGQLIKKLRGNLAATKLWAFKPGSTVADWTFDEPPLRSHHAHHCKK